MRKILGVILLMGFAMLASAQTTLGAWTLLESIDAITDENKSAIGALASDYPSLARNSALVIRCSSSSLRPTGVEVFFAASRYLGSDDFYPIIYRIDRGEPVSDRWSASTNKEAAFIPAEKEVEFLSAIMSGSELIFRITGYSQDYTYTVPIHGLNDALYALGCYKGPAL